MPSDDSSRQMDPAKGRPRGDSAGTGAAPQSREEEAHDTRSGRPMPEEDAANRTAHHKSGYGGEGGEPRDQSGKTETDTPDSE